MQCSKCGAVNTDTAKFCIKCGANLSEGNQFVNQQPMGGQTVNINQPQATVYSSADNNNVAGVKIKGLAGLKVLSIISAIVLAFDLFFIKYLFSIFLLLSIVAACVGIFCKNKVQKMQNTEDIKSFVKTGSIACWVAIISFILNIVFIISIFM